MKPTLRFSRSHFPNSSMLYWATWFEHTLSKKYNVVIDSKNPDLVIFSNLSMQEDKIDAYTGDYAKPLSVYQGNPNIKKIYVSGECTVNHGEVVQHGDDYFAIGPLPVEHPRHLQMNIHNVVTAWGLYFESQLFDDPYNWLTVPRDGQEILNMKKHFCGVVQNSVIPQRIELFEKLMKYKFVRASGNWITNVPPNEVAWRTGRIDGDDYKGKVLFLRDCKFSMQMQTVLLEFTQEKMLHGFASNSIPIFWGNIRILEDGFNPESFINLHDFSSFDEAVQKIIEIDNDDEQYKRMVSAPYFVNNKLPEYYDPDYLIAFVENAVGY